MQHLEVSGAVRHIYIYIYIYVIRQLKVNPGCKPDQSPPPSVEVKNEFTSPRAGEPRRENFLGTRHSAAVPFFF